MDVFYACMFAAFGLIFGSFANVAIHRIPKGMSLFRPGSHCPHCKQKIKWHDNLPLISYLILRGRCRHCQKKISFRYVFLEGLTGILWLASYLAFGLTPLAIISCFVLLAFIILAMIDIDTFEIPDGINIFLALLGVISMFVAPIKGDFLTVDYKSRLFSLLSSLLLLLLFYVSGRLSKKELIGGGDLKLLIAAGLFLGWELQLLGLVFASLIGVLVEIPYRLLSKKSLKARLPFGPYLAMGFSLALFFGLRFLEWYLAFFQLT